MKLSIVHKLSLSFVLLVLISAGVVGGLFYNRTTELLVNHALQNISGEVKSAGEMLQAIVNTHDEDVLFLANTPPIQGMLKTRLDKKIYIVIILLMLSGCRDWEKYLRLSYRENQLICQFVLLMSMGRSWCT